MHEFDETSLAALRIVADGMPNRTYADLVRRAADHIDRLTSELVQARGERDGMQVRHEAIWGEFLDRWVPAAEDICTIPESAFPDYPARADCQSGAAQRMAHDAIDTAQAPRCAHCGNRRGNCPFVAGPMVWCRPVTN